ncbi:MAG: CocE/NonD family hydrolase [Actinobacteria bacterium]|nr:CocE/NonD family hydrolase [Actinomycetota bacterium]
MTDVAQVLVQDDVEATMRDGVALRADVYRPAEPGPYPVLLARTAYGKEQPMDNSVDTNMALAAHGYIVVAQDVRGRFASEGEFNVPDRDIEDGYDTVMWAAALADSTGKVGMFGTSLRGVTQWLAAIDCPPPLKAIMPVNASPNFYEGFRFYGGAFQFADWPNWAAGHAMQWHLPLSTVEGLQGVAAPLFPVAGAHHVRRILAEVARRAPLLTDGHRLLQRRWLARRAHHGQSARVHRPQYPGPHSGGSPGRPGTDRPLGPRPNRTAGRRARLGTRCHR